jgi:flagellar basal body-associated protein FliL
MYPQQPPKKKRGPLFWILIGLATVIVLSIAICGISLANAGKAVTTAVNNASATFTADTSNTGTTNSNSTSTTSGAHYKVGQTANIASMDVTANSTKTSQGDQYSTPKAGNQYLIVDVTVNNKSGKAQTISSLLSFTLQDSTGQKYTETFTSLSGVTAPDGSVQDGAKLRGQLVYEVPKSMKSYTFEFLPSITSTDVATWDISI